MSEVVHIDYIRTIVDGDDELIALVTMSESNILLFRLQINIQDSFSPDDFKFNTFHSLKLSNPTPCQYAVIKNKTHSLKGLINFLCNHNEDYECFALENYKKGLKLDIKSVFCPTCSNTTWPLLHLAVGLGHKECLDVLIDFLKGQNKLSDFINCPDDRQRTPLSIAFATGIDEIIDDLLDNGADPYCKQDVIMPIIFICVHYPEKLPKAIERIKRHNGNDSKVFDPIANLYFDDIGLVCSEEDGKYDLKQFLHNKSTESYELYAQEQQGKGTKITIDDKDNPASNNVNEEQNNNNDNNNNNNDNDKQCSFRDCNESGQQKCPVCKKWYCDAHFEDHSH